MESKSRYRFVIQSAAILVRSCTGLIWASAGPLLPLIMQAYGISRGSASWFASSVPLAIALVSVAIGIFAARFSLKKTFLVGALLQGAGILTPFCTSYPSLLLTRVCFAIGTAIVVPLAIAIAAEWFSNRELPLVNGITMSFVSLGNAVAFLVTVPIVTILSWKAPLTIYGAVALTCATAWAIFGRDRRGAGTVPKATGPTVAEKREELSIRQALTQRSTILLALAIAGTWCLLNSLCSWLPSYYHEVFRMPLEKASSITSIITGAGALSCIIGGIISMRLGRRKPFLIIPGVFMGLSAMSAVIFNSPVAIYISVALFGVISSLPTPTLFTIPMELRNVPPRTGAVIICVMLCGGNLGNFLGPLLIGYVADITGSYLVGFSISVAISLGLLVAGLLLPETGPNARKTKLPAKLMLAK